MNNYGIQPDEQQLAELAENGRFNMQRKKGHFIYKVPIPWVAEAATLPGKCLAVGLAMWFRFGITKRRKVKVTRQLLQKFGVNRDAGRRAIKRLESAGLVTVIRSASRGPLVTLVDVGQEDSGELDE